MTPHDLWLEPDEYRQPRRPLDIDEPETDPEPDGDWGSDEIDHIREQRYDR